MAVKKTSYCVCINISNQYNCFQHSGIFIMQHIHTHTHMYIHTYVRTQCDNKVRELVAIKVLHTSLLNTTMVTYKVLPLGSYAPMPAPSPSFKTILEPVSWNGLQSCCCITPDVVSSKYLSFNISFIFGNRKKSLWARSGE